MTLTTRRLLELPITLHGIELGRPVDAVVDADGTRVIGLDVRCGDGARRFLPLRAAELGATEIRLASALILLDERHVPFRDWRARRLSELRGATVTRASTTLGSLADLVVRNGTTTHVVVDRGGRTVQVPLDDGIRVRERRSSAA